MSDSAISNKNLFNSLVIPGNQSEKPKTETKSVEETSRFLGRKSDSVNNQSAGKTGNIPALAEDLTSQDNDPSAIKKVVTKITGKYGPSQDNISGANNYLKIGKHAFTNIREIPSGDLEYAKISTADKNYIDEVFFKDLSSGKLYVAFGREEDNGSLGNINDITAKRRGYFNGNVAEIVHIDNEINTPIEGAKGPFVKTWKVLAEATEKGISSGIAGLGGAGVALFLSKNIATSAKEAAVAEVAKASASSASGGFLTGSKTALSSIGRSLGSAARVAGAVTITVGVVAGTLSAIGYFGARNPDNDFSTIDEITDPNLVPPQPEKTEE